MKWTVFCLIAAMTVALGGACGGDDSSESSFEQYFREFEMIEERADERSQAIEDDLDGLLGDLASGSFEEDRDRIEELLDDSLEIFDDYLDDADDLDPPDELKDLHERYLDAVAELRDDLEDAVAGFKNADSLGEVADAFAEFDVPTDRASQLCEELEGAARDQNIEVNLQCEDE